MLGFVFFWVASVVVYLSCFYVDSLGSGVFRRGFFGDFYF